MPNEWREKLNEPKGKLSKGKVGWNSFLFFSFSPFFYDVYSLDSLARATNLSNR